MPVVAAAFTIGAKPMVIWLASPLIEGKLVDSILPIESLTGVLKGADAWLQINNKMILYSTPGQVAWKTKEYGMHFVFQVEIIR